MRQGVLFSIIVSIVFCSPVLAYDWSTNPGDGSPENPYQISTVNDWMELIGASAEWNKHFILTADIDFEGAAILPVARDTDPSRGGFQGTSFTGMLDGGGHVLRNFVVHQPDSFYVGLFGQVGSGGQILNLGVEPLQVTGRYYVGGLCGYNIGTISTSYVTGTVSGASYVGGLCGYNYSGSITNSYAACSIGGNDFFLGGLVGANYKGGIIEKCYSAGTNTEGYVEALCGANYSGSTISNCYLYLFSGLDKDYGTVIETADAEADMFFGFDFAGNSEDGTDDYWTIVSGHCPKLTWQSDDGPLPPPSPVTTLSGNGYPDNPFLINNIADFMEFATNSGLTLGYYTLTTDIDLSDKVFTNAPVNRAFGGHFAGNSHIVSNLTIDTEGNGNDYLGLFRTISVKSAEIYDLGIIDCNIVGDASSGPVGSLCGGNSGSIRNCFSTGNVSGGWRVGGLMGYNYRNVRDCFSMTRVSGSGDSIGGFCGSNSGSIEDCYTTGAVFGGEDADWLGGFCGVNFNSISQCYATGIVEGGDGSSSIGGFLGLITGSGSPPGPDLLDTQADYLGEPMRESEGPGQGVYHCYFLESAGPHNGYGTPLTDAQMKHQASFVGWDFMNIWLIDEDNDYPYLQWELTNTPPVGDAGEDAVAFAFFDGYACVTLDGTDSYDEDEDALEYFWYYANELIATGAEPNVMLPVGDHVIDLIVNDGIEDSEPNDVVITVIQALKVPMNLTPRTLNCRSQGNWVKAHFTLSEEYSISDINPNRPAVVHSYGIESALLELSVNKEKRVEITASFDREQICSLAGDWPEVFRVYGFFTDGSVFYGESDIRINPAGLKEVSELAMYWLGDCESPKWCDGLDMNRDTIINLQDYPLLLNSEVEFITE